jgi:hypothetical protein
MYMTEIAWWDGIAKTGDDKHHNYSAAECHSTSGTTIRLTFREYGSFTAFSEEAAIKVFQEWYDENIKTEESDMRDEIREPPIRNGNRE